MNIVAGHRLVLFGTAQIEYELLFSKRKQLAIHVYPDCSVVVDAPLGSDEATIQESVLKRAAWILRQQRQFQDYPVVSPLPHRYVSGEAYRYMGRQYRLKVIVDTIERVHLNRGCLTVSVADLGDKSRIAKLIHNWYFSHAKRLFVQRLEACYPRVEFAGIIYPELVIRDMKARWGSSSPRGRITLNLKLIYTPKVLIDYVILHELCHLKEHHHGADFYALFERVLPDWRERRAKLNSFEFR